jgi:hypothetical protein
LQNKPDKIPEAIQMYRPVHLLAFTRVVLLPHPTAAKMAAVAVQAAICKASLIMERDIFFVVWHFLCLTPMLLLEIGPRNIPVR